MVQAGRHRASKPHNVAIEFRWWLGGNEQKDIYPKSKFRSFCSEHAAKRMAPTYEVPQGRSPLAQWHVSS